MAGTTRFELASNSSEGSAFTSTYSNGLRGTYGGAKLSRSGSFRENIENQRLTSREMPLLSQSLMLEPLTMGDQKFTRLGELRRVLGVSLGTLENHSFGAGLFKPPNPIASDELKRLKESVLDTSIRARERAQMLRDSIIKLDKYRRTLFSKKRQRNEISSGRSSGANSLKMGSQIHHNPSDLITQRLDDRIKNAVPNKRVRTSVAESEGRITTLSRQSVVMDKDRDMPRTGNGGIVQVEDKIRGLPAGGDGWEKKTKRKRSAGIVVSRTMDCDREPKQGIQQRLNNESCSRSCDGNGFRLNICEDNQIGNSSAVTKGKASRTPRTSASVLANSSSTFVCTSSAHDGWEQSPCLNKVQSMSGANNHKRPMHTESSSPPVAQWVGQRPQKNSRTRRTNLVSPVSNHGEAQILSEGFPASDIGDRLNCTGTNGPQTTRVISNSTQQCKMEIENISSPAGLSECEETGAVENKSKDKGIENGEIEGRDANAVQKVSTCVLPMKKSKILLKEEVGDGVRRQGRSGRGLAQLRACMPSVREKLENKATMKPLRTTSKPGRPAKKQSNHKAFTRPGHVLISGSSDFTGESDDDHEELLEAANSARNASYHACSGSFWKKMETFFAFVSSADIAYLKQQINFAEVDEIHMFDDDHITAGEPLCEALPSSQALVFGERRVNQPNGIGLKKYARTLSSVKESWEADTLNGKLETERWFQKIVPLSQRLLAAIIVEDGTEDFDHSGDQSDAHYQYISDDSPCGACSQIDNDLKDPDRMESEIESEVDLKTQKHCSLDNFSCDGSTASNNFRSPNFRNPLHSDELWQEDDVLVHSDVGVTNESMVTNFDEPQTQHTDSPGFSSFEYQYQQMCLDDRILVELQSIGVLLDSVPDLYEGEDEEITENISELKKGLYRQVNIKKGQLCKLEKAIQKGREMEEQELEKLAMTKLVGMAYKKHMACRGSNSSSNKSIVKKVTKQAALAFANRTISRCRKFEDTGRSCFSDPALLDAIFSASLSSSNTKCIGDGSHGTAANLQGEAHNYHPESGVSAAGALASSVLSSTVERHRPINDKLDKGSFDAFQDLAYTSDQTFDKHETMSNRGKRREVLLNDVVGSDASRVASTLDSSLLGGAKGMRSERDRDQNKELLTRNSVVKAGRPSLGNFRGERKTKTKPKQKIANLSTPGNVGLLGGNTETTDSMFPSVWGSCETVKNGSSKVTTEVGLLCPGNIAQDSSKETEQLIDPTNLQLHGIDTIEELVVSGDLVGQGQDLSSWLNFDEDDLQEHDLMGLDIPMDDISKLNMII